MPPAKKSKSAGQVEALRKALKRERAKSARLQAQLAEALGQQAATGEILRVISASPGDVLPVFASILEWAAGLCGAQQALLWLYETGAQFRLGAAHGGRAEY